MSKETYFFSHDYNARGDRKLVKLIMKHGMTGIGIYWCIVEMLYEEGGYLPLEYERITFELRTKENVIQSVINDFDLFEKDSEKFWSESVLDRLNQRCSKSEKARESINKRWNKIKTDTNVLRSNEERNTIKERKEEESKVKDSKENNKIVVSVETRKQEFYKSLIPFLEKHSKEMVKAFYDYWSELNTSGKKMRWELQKTWETNLRLNTWSNREKIKSNERNNTIQGTSAKINGRTDFGSGYEPLTKERLDAALGNKP